MNKQTKVPCAGIIVSLIMIFLGTMPECQNAETSVRYGEGFVQAGDDLELYYRIAGSGPDTLVVLHGGPGLNFDYLAPDLEPLAESHTLIFYDQRGSARSTLITDSSLVHIDKHIEDIEAVRRHFGLQNMFLLGHSWGAGLAARYALKYPDHLSGVILVGAMAPRYEPHWARFRQNRSAWMDDEIRSRHLERVAERNAATDPAEYQRLCREVARVSFAGMFHDPHDPENFNRMRGDYCSPALSPEMRESSRLVNTLTWRSIENWNWLDDFHETDVPVLVLHGKSDPMPLESAREWAEAIPNARFAVIENAGHKPYIERPEEFFRTVTEFLNGEYVQ
jgi:proline iminopeptidase